MDYTSIIGVDVASKKLDLCYMQDDQLQYQTVDYSEEKLDELFEKKLKISLKCCTIGMESTGEYHLKAARYFLKKGSQVKVLNPILTNQYTRATIRGMKTDKTDSKIIHDLIARGEGYQVTAEELSNQQKEFLRLAASLTGKAVQLKLQLQSTRRKEIAGTEDVEEKMLKVIKEIESLSNELVEKATEERSREEELIDSIPGFAVKLSAIVHHEIGDIHRFDNVKSLVAYAGLDPRVKQSGEQLKTSGRITKRGSKMLRSALYMAANVARRYDPGLNKYYEKKKDEGRSHKEILCMIGRKLLFRIVAVIKEDRPYVVEKE